MKPGWQTTEFWMSIVFALIGLLASIGVIGPADRPGIEGAAQTIIQNVAGLVSAILIIWRYISSRQQLKQHHTDAEVKVLTNPKVEGTS